MMIARSKPTIICDTRQHDVPIWREVQERFEQLGCDTVNQKLDFGDYAVQGDMTVSVDTKQGFSEIVHNFCSGTGRKRTKAEIARAKEANAELIYLIVDYVADCIEDAKHWINLHGKVKGTTLYKTLDTYNKRYGVRFEFCKPCDAAETILRLLSVDYETG